MRRKMPLIKEMANVFNNFNVIGKKDNQTSVSDEDRNLHPQVNG